MNPGPNAIEIIRDHIRDKPSAVLDRQIGDVEEIRAALRVAQVGTDCVTVCRDVPVWAVVGLGRDGAACRGDTWRDAATLRLTDHWPLPCLDYLEGVLFKTLLPQGNARLFLEMASIGGAVFCSNGNHRLIAAIAWRVTNGGDAAVLNKAHLNIHHHSEEVIELLLGMRRKRAKIFHRAVDQCGSIVRYVKAVDRSGVETLHKVENGRIGEDRLWHPLLGRFSGCKPPEFMGNWKPFPDQVLDTWSRRREWDGWRGHGEAVPLDEIADFVIDRHGANGAPWCREQAKKCASWVDAEKLWEDVAATIEARSP